MTLSRRTSTEDRIESPVQVLEGDLYVCREFEYFDGYKFVRDVRNCCLM